MTKRYAYKKIDDEGIYYNILTCKCCTIDELTFESTFPTLDSAQEVLKAHELSPLYEYLTIVEVAYSFQTITNEEAKNMKDDKYIAIDLSLLNKVTS